MPNDMEKLIRELPRYRNPILVLFKRISDECMTARPDPAIPVTLQFLLIE
jgi:hypothetical protein